MVFIIRKRKTNCFYQGSCLIRYLATRFESEARVKITQSRGMTGIAKLGMKMAASDVVVNHENETSDKKTSDSSVKVICLGDSAVGKSK